MSHRLPAHHWEMYKDLLAALDKKDVHKLLKLTRAELALRWEEQQAEVAWVRAGFTGLANFMAGVTWALACRQTLRRSKGHTPDTGKRPQSGEMWLPREMLYAVRHEVKDRRWSPLSQPDARGCLEWLKAEATRRPQVSEQEADGLEGMMSGNARDFRATQFHVKMAAPVYGSVTFDDPHSRFDPGGEG
jgi:hypothetical protein